jgi:hypothetical protein
VSKELRNGKRDSVLPLPTMYWQTAPPSRPVMECFETVDTATKSGAGIFASQPEVLIM